MAHCCAFYVAKRLAGTTGLEPATSDVTGRRSNQLNYVPFSLKTSDIKQNSIANRMAELVLGWGAQEILSFSL